MAQLGPEFYNWESYVVRGRWASYWHQIAEVRATGAATCLEIGTGPGVVRDTLRRLGMEVTTVDVDAALGVDRIGDVRALPCEDGEFEVVLCSQVLEHIPWPDVPTAVGELRRVCRSHAIVSLPQSGIDVGFSLAIRGLSPLSLRPLARDWRLIGRLNRPRRFAFDGHHHWQVCSRGTGRSHVRAVLTGGFELEREYTVPEFTYHRFYVLRKLI